MQKGDTSDPADDDDENSQVGSCIRTEEMKMTLVLSRFSQCVDMKLSITKTQYKHNSIT